MANQTHPELEKFDSIPSFVVGILLLTLLAPVFNAHGRNTSTSFQNPFETTQQIPPEVLNALAGTRALRSEHRYLDALQLLETLSPIYPDSIALHLELARMLALIERNEQAVLAYEKVLSMDRTDEVARIEYAWVLTLNSQFKEALHEYDPLIEEKPLDIDLRLRRAMALYGIGDIRHAMKEYEDILEIDPSRIEAQIALRELQELIPGPFSITMSFVFPLILLVVVTGMIVLVFLHRRPAHRSLSHGKSRIWEERYIRTVSIISLIVAAYYITWRLTSTMNWEAWWFSVPVFLAEAYGLVIASIYFFMVWKPTNRIALPPLAGRSVDIFITTYNEDPAILKKTILGSLEITYPHTTYVLDDGNRPEVAQLARKFHCQYIAREKNINAKAGNLNNALRKTSGEFIVTLDADHVPQPHFIDKLIGYFSDPKVAFVQTPQDFYNIDSYQHRLNLDRRKMWTEQSLFFTVIQPGKDAWNSAFYCGSCAILRRAALDEIGGFAEGTITEDLHTSILLHSRGHKSVYHNESLAFGLAPETVIPFQVQRLRWGQGAMQVFARDNPFWIRGLTLPQRLSYFASMATYFDGFQKMIFYLSPVVYFSTGILPILSFDVVFLAHFIPYFVLFILSYQLMSRGRGSLLYTELYNMAKFATFIKATLGLFAKRRLKFRVTPKTQAHFDTKVVLLPQYIVLLLNLSGLGLGSFRYFWKADLETLAYFGNVFWSVLISLIALNIIRFTSKKVQHRKEYRFLFFLPCTYATSGKASGSTSIGLLLDCNEQGASLLTPAPLKKGESIKIAISIGEEIIGANGRVIQSSEEGSTESRYYRQSIDFTRMSEKDRNFLIKYSFEFTIPHLMAKFNRPSTVFERLERYLRENHRKNKRWSFSLPTTLKYTKDLHKREVLAAIEDISAGGMSLLCEDEIPIMQPVEFDISLADRTIKGQGRVLRKEKILHGDFQMLRHALVFDRVKGGDLNSIEELTELLQSIK